MENQYDPWDYITEENEEVIVAVNKLKKSYPDWTKIITDYMESLVKRIAILEEPMREGIFVMLKINDKYEIEIFSKELIEEMKDKKEFFGHAIAIKWDDIKKKGVEE